MSINERLDAIEARKNAATPGPWNLLPSQFPNAEQVTHYNAQSGFAGFTEQIADNVAPNDAEFIAHAPEDVAYLLVLARKQQAALERVEAIASEYMADYNSGIEIHYADLETLRAAITKEVEA